MCNRHVGVLPIEVASSVRDANFGVAAHDSAPNNGGYAAPHRHSSSAANHPYARAAPLSFREFALVVREVSADTAVSGCSPRCGCARPGVLR